MIKGVFFLLAVLAVSSITPAQNNYMIPAGRLAEGFDSTIAQIISHVSDYPLLLNISLLQDFGSRRWDQTNRDSVFSWAYDRFLETGMKDIQFDSFAHSGTMQKNIVATIPGHIHPKTEIIIGGHIDSQNPNQPGQAPGADDNASGTAAVIEMARVLQSINYQPAVTLKFICFVAEESNLAGSSHYAQMVNNRNDDITVMMNFDMIAYRNQLQADRDYYLVTYPGSEMFSQLQATMATTYTSLHPVYTTSYINQSDSYPFYQNGFHATFSIERDFNPYYHTTGDQFMYLDIQYAREIVQSGLAALLTLDQYPPPVSGLQVLDKGDGSTLVVLIDNVNPPDFSEFKILLTDSVSVQETMYVNSAENIQTTSLTDGMRYMVEVSVIDLAGLESPITKQTSTPRSIPLAPSNIAASAVQNGVQLSWQPNQEMDIAGYNIFRQTTIDPSEQLIQYQPHPISSWIDFQPPVGLVTYRICAIDSSQHQSLFSDSVTVSYVVAADENSEIPVSFSLKQNFPNPFNPQTTIEYSLPEDAFLNLSVYDIAGRHIATIVQEVKKAGSYSVTWNAGPTPSGLYFYQLQAGKISKTKKMLLIR